MPQDLINAAKIAEDVPTYKVHFEPVGIEMNVREGETVLNAAFRQGISLMHGCKEGQCSSCKSRLLEGDIELLKYSTFALPDYERDADHILLCRTLAYSDISVELLNYDEDLLRRSIAVKEFDATVKEIVNLTHDIRLLRIDLSAPLKFWAGQYVDITIPGADITRSFSMANAPDMRSELEFIIKKYPQGAFSAQLDGELKSGDHMTVKGPYGTCFRREAQASPMILIGGGSGMSPLWSILNDHVRSGEERKIYFFYGARSKRDLFYLEELSALEKKLPNFHFIPALSHAEPADDWHGATGFVHEVVARVLKAEGIQGDMDAYSCGPPPMIDAVVPVLQMAGAEPDRIFCDKFTPATR